MDGEEQPNVLGKGEKWNILDLGTNYQSVLVITEN